MGDRGQPAVKLKLSKREQREAQRNRVDCIKVRMQSWNDDFIKKIYFDPKTIPDWFQAAKETLNERKVPGGPIKPQHPKKKQKTPKEVRQALSTNWKLDRQLDQKLKNDM